MALALNNLQKVDMPLNKETMNLETMLNHDRKDISAYWRKEWKPSVFPNDYQKRD